jgi:hypothetical protein
MSKDCFAPVSTAKHVIDRARILNAQPPPRLLCQYLALTPFLPFFGAYSGGLMLNRLTSCSSKSNRS